MKHILKALVGSQAHGLAEPTSDRDYRGVFALPTSELLTIGAKPAQTHWTEKQDGTDDTVEWEVAHYLFLATKCNPTVLEVLVSPEYEADEWGEEMRQLFPYMWSSQGVRDAFIGYGLNQRKKFLDNTDGRRNKYATAYLRTLFNAWELLTTGMFSVNIRDTEIYEQAKRFRHGEYEIGEVIQTCEDWRLRVSAAYDTYPWKQTDTEPVSKFLLRLRKEYWA